MIRKFIIIFAIFFLNGLIGDIASAQTPPPNVPAEPNGPPEVKPDGSAEPNRPRWHTILPSKFGGGITRITPGEACWQQMRGYGGSGLLAPKQVAFDKFACDWKVGRIKPGFVYLVCGNGVRPVAPGECPPANGAERGQKECSCSDGDAPQSGSASPTAGNPIILSTGTKIQNETDYSSADGLLRVDRTYRSRFRGIYTQAPLEASDFGMAWGGVVPGRLVISGYLAGQIDYLPSSGSLIAFAPLNPASASDLNYKNIADSRAKLAFEDNVSDRLDYLLEQPAVENGPGEIRVSMANGDYTLFRRSGAKHPFSRTRYAVAVEHGKASGYKQYFDYNVGAEHPFRMRDNHGRELRFEWLPSNIAGPGKGAHTHVVSQITLPDTTKLQYEYDANGTWTNPQDPNTAVRNRLRKMRHISSSNEILFGRDYLYEVSGDPAKKSRPDLLTGILDQNGARLATYGYDDRGYAISTQRAGGVDSQTITQVEPNDATVERTVTNAIGNVTTYAFQKGGAQAVAGRLLQVVTSPSQAAPAQSQNWGYGNPDGSLIAVTTGTGTSTSGTGTDTGFITTTTDVRGFKTDFVNDNENGRPTSTIEGVGTPEQRTTITQWHPDFDLPVKEERDGLRIDSVYDAQARLVSQTETDITTHDQPYTTSGQSRTTVYSWTNTGRIASINGPLEPDAQGIDDVTSFAYDAGSNLISITNPLGHITRFEAYDANGRPGRSIDENSIVTSFTYDLLGRTTAITVEHPTDPLQNAVTVMEYDVEGRVIGLTTPQTAKMAMTYDLAGRLLHIAAPDGESIDFTYDGMSNVLSQTVKRADGSSSSAIQRSFDSLSRMLTEKIGPGRISSYSYDKAGNPIRMQSGRGYTNATSFDALNRLTSTVAPDNSAITSQYNQRDEQTSFTDPNNVTTTFVRNAFGEVIQEASPDRGTSVYYYDAAGRMTAMVDGRGQRVDYTVDVLGRTTQKTPLGLPAQAIRYIYDTPAIADSFAVGRLSEIHDGSGVTRFAYDHRGNRTMKRQTVGATANADLRYAYDLADRVTLIIYPSGRIVDYIRDDKGRITGVNSRASAAAPAVALMSDALYEPFASLKTARFGNGTALDQDWGNDRRLAAKRLYNQTTDANLSAYIFAYDNDDNLTSRVDRVNAAGTLNFAYDSRDRLTQMTLDASASAPVKRRDWVYDANGNWLSDLRRANADDADPSALTRFTIAPGSNRLTAANDNAGGGRSFTHDARGNLTSETRAYVGGGGAAVSASYDGYGRLTVYIRSGVAALTHVYNGMDDRVAQSGGAAGDRRHYIYDDAGRMMGEYGPNAGAVFGETIWLNPDVANDNSPFGGDDGMGGYGMLAIASRDSVSAASVIDWVHSDQVGGLVSLVDASGTPVTLGSRAYILPQAPGQHRTLDDLYYNRYRDYDPTLGRYIQADPIGLDGGPSPYNYAMNNPLRYTDPTGEFVPLIVPILAGVFIGGGIEAAIQFGSNLARRRDVFNADCYDFGEIALAGGMGAFGGGAGRVIGGGLRYGARSLTRETGLEWSHTIGRKLVDRYTKGALRRALNKRGGLNGRWVTPKQHYKHDPHRWLKGGADVWGKKYSQSRQRLDRTPAWLRGIGAGAGVGAAAGEADGQ